jgi:molecular chaperone GrpE
MGTMTEQTEKQAKSKDTKRPSVTKQQKGNGDHSLQKKIKEKESEFKKVKEQLLRTAAELENVKKRKEREIALIIRSANDKLISDILPVLDDFERFFKASEEHRKSNELEEGANLIYQKLLSALTNYGLRPMESKGMSFNVDEHDALLQVEKEGVQPGVVVEEHEKGYYLNDRVLRHAKVLVSK